VQTGLVGVSAARLLRLVCSCGALGASSRVPERVGFGSHS
jgi:hypothetical protein